MHFRFPKYRVRSDFFVDRLKLWDIYILRHFWCILFYRFILIVNMFFSLINHKFMTCYNLCYTCTTGREFISCVVLSFPHFVQQPQNNICITLLSAKIKNANIFRILFQLKSATFFNRQHIHIAESEIKLSLCSIFLKSPYMKSVSYR